MQFCSKVNKYVGLALGLVIYIYIARMIYKEKKEKNEIRPAILAIGIYLTIILAALLISLIMQSVILLDRYLIVITGLLIFFIAFFMSKEKKTYITIMICSTIFIISLIDNILFIKENYDSSNNSVIEFMEDNIEKDDAILYCNSEYSGFVVGTRYSENRQYFYNYLFWDVEEAYKAFGPNMEIIYNLDELKDYHGRIWILDTGDYRILNELKEKYDIEVVSQNDFNTAYNNYVFHFALIEK